MSSTYHESEVFILEESEDDNVESNSYLHEMTTPLIHSEEKIVNYEIPNNSCEKVISNIVFENNISANLRAKLHQSSGVQTDTTSNKFKDHIRSFNEEEFCFDQYKECSSFNKGGDTPRFYHSRKRFRNLNYSMYAANVHNIKAILKKSINEINEKLEKEELLNYVYPFERSEKEDMSKEPAWLTTLESHLATSYCLVRELEKCTKKFDINLLEDNNCIETKRNIKIRLDKHYDQSIPFEQEKNKLTNLLKERFTFTLEEHELSSSNDDLIQYQENNLHKAINTYNNCASELSKKLPTHEEMLELIKSNDKLEIQCGVMKHWYLVNNYCKNHDCESNNEENNGAHLSSILQRVSAEFFNDVKHITQCFWLQKNYEKIKSTKNSYRLNDRCQSEEELYWLDFANDVENHNIENNHSKKSENSLGLSDHLRQNFDAYNGYLNFLKTDYIDEHLHEEKYHELNTLQAELLELKKKYNTLKENLICVCQSTSNDETTNASSNVSDKKIESTTDNFFIRRLASTMREREFAFIAEIFKLFGWKLLKIEPSTILLTLNNSQNDNFTYELNLTSNSVLDANEKLKNMAHFLTSHIIRQTNSDILKEQPVIDNNITSIRFLNSENEHLEEIKNVERDIDKCSAIANNLYDDSDEEEEEEEEEEEDDNTYEKKDNNYGDDDKEENDDGVNNNDNINDTVGVFDHKNNNAKIRCENKDEITCINNMMLNTNYPEYTEQSTISEHGFSVEPMNQTIPQSVVIGKDIEETCMECVYDENFYEQKLQYQQYHEQELMSTNKTQDQTEEIYREGSSNTNVYVINETSHMDEDGKSQESRTLLNFIKENECLNFNVDVLNTSHTDIMRTDNEKLLIKQLHRNKLEHVRMQEESYPLTRRLEEQKTSPEMLQTAASEENLNKLSELNKYESKLTANNKNLEVAIPLFSEENSEAESVKIENNKIESSNNHYIELSHREYGEETDLKYKHISFCSSNAYNIEELNESTNVKPRYTSEQEHIDNESSYHTLQVERVIKEVEPTTNITDINAAYLLHQQMFEENALWEDENVEDTLEQLEREKESHK